MPRAMSSLKRGNNQLRFEHLEDRSLMASNVLPTLVTGHGSTLHNQDAFSVNLQETTVNGLPTYAGTLSFADSLAGKTFTAASITAVNVEQPAATAITSGVLTTNGYFSIAGTAKLNDGTDTSYKFTAKASLPFPTTVGSTGGLAFEVTGPNGVVYSTPWKPWDAGENLAITLVPAPHAATTTHLTSSVTSSVYGQAVEFKAAVATVGSTVLPGGSVSFTIDNGTPIAAPLANGYAVIHTSALSVGSHKIVASYLGTSLNAASSETIAALPVAKAHSITYLSYAGSLTVGQPLTLKSYVGVESPGAGVRTGSITFYDGNTSLGTVQLVGTNPGVQLALPTGLGVGSHQIFAVYSGDGNFTESHSQTLTKSVAAYTTYTQLKSSVNPVLIGQSVELTALVRKPTTSAQPNQ